MIDEFNIQNCETEQTTSLPQNTVTAMSYIPFQQWGASLYDADNALNSGTLFPELNKPFTGKVGELK